MDLIDMRDKGGLRRPAKAVIHLCRNTETIIISLSPSDLGSRFLKQKIQTTVLNDIDNPFPDDHQSGLDSHSMQLAKLVIATYLAVRLHHVAKLLTEEAVGKRLRSKLTKTILFAHQ